MKRNNLLWTLFLLMTVLFSGCIQQKFEGIELANQVRKDVFSNDTLMFEMKIPSGWKSDAMYIGSFFGVMNFVNEKYPWYPWGDDSVIRLDLKDYGTLSIVQVNMDKHIVPMGYTLEYARSDQMNIKDGIIYEGYTELGGEKAWEIIRKYKMNDSVYEPVGDLYQRDIFVIHGKKLYQLSFRVISTDVERRDNVTAELEPDFNEIFTSFRFID
jgi:hypothetical protein